VNARLYRYRLPLTEPVALRGMTLRQREGVLVCLTDGAATGWGEVAPLPGFSHESLPEAEIQLQTLLSTWNGEPTALTTWLLYPSVRFGLEQALLHLEAVQKGTTLAALLGVPRPFVRVNGLITRADDLVERARALRVAGYTAVKLKVGGQPVEDDIRRVNRLAEVLGPNIALRLDANRAWDEPTARHFAEGVAHQTIAYLEEPLYEGAPLPDYPIPLALDETLAGLAPEDLAAYPGIRAVILKPTVLGGFRRALQFAAHARRAGIEAVVSGAFESGVGVQGLLALAAVLDDTPAGLDPYRWLARDVLASPLPLPAPTVQMGRLDATFSVNLTLIREFTRFL
jgi:O-succinylbenzoate synthase